MRAVGLGTDGGVGWQSVSAHHSCVTIARASMTTAVLSKAVARRVALGVVVIFVGLALAVTLHMRTGMLKATSAEFRGKRVRIELREQNGTLYGQAGGLLQAIASIHPNQTMHYTLSRQEIKDASVTSDSQNGVVRFRLLEHEIIYDGASFKLRQL